LIACNQVPPSPLAPSAVGGGAGAAHLELDPDDRYGALGSEMRVMTSGVPDVECALGPFGLAEQSNFVESSSGNESLVCTGSTAVRPERATILTDFPCMLPSGTITTDSHLVLTPSGRVTLTCHAKKVKE
jgi:hypothetical protein